MFLTPKMIPLAEPWRSRSTDSPPNPEIRRPFVLTTGPRLKNNVRAPDGDGMCM